MAVESISYQNQGDWTTICDMLLWCDEEFRPIAASPSNMNTVQITALIMVIGLEMHKAKGAPFEHGIQMEKSIFPRNFLDIDQIDALIALSDTILKLLRRREHDILQVADILRFDSMTRHPVDPLDIRNCPSLLDSQFWKDIGVLPRASNHQDLTDTALAHHARLLSNWDSQSFSDSCWHEIHGSYLGWSPLHYCAVMDMRETERSREITPYVHQLINSEGIDLNITDLAGWTPLHYAVVGYRPTLYEELWQSTRSTRHYISNRGVIKLLLAYKANPSLGNRNGVSPLHLMAANSQIRYSNSIEYLSLMLEAVGDVQKVKDRNGMTPLHWMANSSYTDQISYQVLIDYGAEPTFTDINGRNALHHAVLSRNMSFIRFLLPSFATPDVQDGLGFTALHYAAYWGYCRILECLIKDLKSSTGILSSTGLTAIHLAAHAGRIEAVKILLEAGATVNVNVPLNIGELTIDIDPKRDLVSKDGILSTHYALLPFPSPLESAAANGHEKIFNMLRKMGAVPNLCVSRIEISCINIANGGKFNLFPNAFWAAIGRGFITIATIYLPQML